MTPFFAHFGMSCLQASYLRLLERYGAHALPVFEVSCVFADEFSRSYFSVLCHETKNEKWLFLNALFYFVPYIILSPI